MSDVRVSTLSVEKIRVPVTARESGLAIDPTADVVHLAVKLDGTDPVIGDFKAGEWEPDGTVFYARILVGPGTLVGELTPGKYRVWVKVFDSPETPVKETSNRLVIY